MWCFDVFCRCKLWCVNVAEEYQPKVLVICLCIRLVKTFHPSKWRRVVPLRIRIHHQNPSKSRHRFCRCSLQLSDQDIPWPMAVPCPLAAWQGPESVGTPRGRKFHGLLQTHRGRLGQGQTRGQLGSWVCHVRV